MSSSTRKRKFPTPKSRTTAPKVTPRTSTSTSTSKSQSSKSSTSKSSKSSKSATPSSKKQERPEDDLLYESDEDHDDDDKIQHDTTDVNDEDEYQHETVDEKRIRLAKNYLQKLGEMKEDDLDSDDDTRTDADVLLDPIAHRLQKDIARQSGTFQKHIASRIQPHHMRTMKGHQYSVTAVTLNHDETYVYSASKDATIIQWDIETGKKVHTFKHVRGNGTVMDGHLDQIWCLAISSDGLTLASGGRDMGVHLWDTRTHQHTYTLKGHRDTVTGVAFQMGTQQLFSCSADRTVKIWNCQERSYVDTLFGHQADVQGIDCLYDEEPITCGSDRYLRLWKVREETQLAYNNGHAQSIDTVAMINQEKFVTGGQDGMVCLWSSARKKPVGSLAHAHGGEWISSVAALPYSDLIASGSSNSYLHLYSTEGDPTKHTHPSNDTTSSKQRTSNQLHLLHKIPMIGFINSIKFARSGRFLVAGIGQEHRMGRWSRIPEARNGIQVISLMDKTNSSSSNTNTSKQPNGTTGTNINGLH